MTIDQKTMEQTYKWRNDKNKIPFKWKCQHCRTITTITEIDTTKRYSCSNPNCEIKLKFVLFAIT